MREDKRLEDVPLTDEEIRKVIERATRNTAGFDTISVGELRLIAEELDIDADSFEVALREVMRQEPVAPVKKKSLQLAQGVGVRTLVMGAGGWILGVISGQFAWVAHTVVLGQDTALGSSSNIDEPVMIAMAALMLTSLVLNPKSTRLKEYLVDGLVLWSSFLTSWMIIRGVPTIPISIFVGSGMTISAGAGALLFRFNSSRKNSDQVEVGAEAFEGVEVEDGGSNVLFSAVQLRLRTAAV